MAIKPERRLPISQVPPLRVFGDTSAGDLGTALEKWLPQIVNNVYKTRVDTSTDVAGNGVLTNVLIIPNSRGLWFCHVSIGPVNDAVNYQAAGLVLIDGTSARMIQTWNGPLQTIALAGNTIQSAQTSGGPQKLTGTAIQLLQF